MSGVVVGTRLERLRELRAQVDREIAAEERRVATGAPAPRSRGSLSVAPWEGIAEHVTSRDIKEWAVRQGLLERPRRGRAPRHLVDAYRKAHTP